MFEHAEIIHIVSIERSTRSQIGGIRGCQFALRFFCLLLELRIIWEFLFIKLGVLLCHVRISLFKQDLSWTPVNSGIQLFFCRSLTQRGSADQQRVAEKNNQKSAAHI